MALDGTAWAGVFDSMREYLGGVTPNELTPTAGGDAIEFNHNGIFRDTVDTPAGPIVQVRMEVATTTALALKSSYTFDSQTWEVVDQQLDKVGAGDGPRHYTLIRHAQ